MNVQGINRQAWNQRVKEGINPYTQPVTSAQVATAKRGEWQIFLTGGRPIPSAWLEVAERDVLCLASGGGQQGPLLAAAGARVTVFDLSDEQLAQDRLVAERDGLELQTVQGSMTDLSAFADASFDTIIHPISNCFVPDVNPVWREAYRVLRPGGHLLAGMVNPVLYALDDESEDDRLVVRHKIPYSDLENLNPDEQQGRFSEGRALEFGHTLDDLIGGQLAAGFTLTGFYEDRFPGKPVDDYLAVLLVTRALKPH